MAFYAPLSGILLLYGLIFRQTRSRVRKRMDATLNSTLYEIAKNEKDLNNASCQSSTASLQPSVPASTPPATPTGSHSNYSQSSYGSLRSSGRLWSCCRQGSRWSSHFQRTQRRSNNTTNTNKKTSRKQSKQEETVADSQRAIMLTTIAETPSVRDNTLKVGENVQGECASHFDGGQEARTSSEQETPLVDSPSKHNGSAPKTSLEVKHSPARARRPTKLVKKLSGSLSARHRNLLKREKKAATTLAVITL